MLEVTDFMVLCLRMTETKYCLPFCYPSYVVMNQFKEWRGITLLIIIKSSSSLL